MREKQICAVPVIAGSEEYVVQAKALAEKLGTEYVLRFPEGGAPVLMCDANGVSLTDGRLSMRGDFCELARRADKSRLQSEMLVKASRIKDKSSPLTLIDATAGMGEDSFLLAAAGFSVELYEYNPVIFTLLEDALKRAAKADGISEIAGRMHLHCENSVEAMKKLDFTPDVILLDPMFPERQKSALIKKKFQLLQKLEAPCSGEEELLESAISAKPHKIVIKRPLKGPFLAGRKPDYSLTGKAIRYDCLVFARQ